jgi:hypothetical protein
MASQAQYQMKCACGSGRVRGEVEAEVEGARMLDMIILCKNQYIDYLLYLFT